MFQFSTSGHNPSCVSLPENLLMFASTSSAMATMSISCCIRFVIWMTRRTMSLFKVEVASPSSIYKSRDWLQVGRINASFISTKMVYLQAWCNWAIGQFIGKSMGSYDITLNSEASVALALMTKKPLPQPAFCGASASYKVPEALCSRKKPSMISIRHLQLMPILQEI